MEQSFDYPNIDALLDRLAHWMESADRAQAIHFRVAAAISHPHSPSPPALYDRIVHRAKNHAFAVAVSIAIIVILILADAIEALAYLYAQ